MRLLWLVSTLGLIGSAFSHLRPSTVDSYVSTESPIAKVCSSLAGPVNYSLIFRVLIQAGLLANIGPSGSKSAGAKVSQRANISPSHS